MTGGEEEGGGGRGEGEAEIHKKMNFLKYRQLGKY